MNTSNIIKKMFNIHIAIYNIGYITIKKIDVIVKIFTV